MIASILGYILIISSLFDALKYVWQAEKIKKVRTARGHSRKFLNVAWLNDVIKTIYGIAINDWFIILSSLLAVITVSYNYYMVYIYYNYGTYPKRKLIEFKRPGLLVYIWNSILPNRYRPKL